tara:strand:+ start:7348 stop:7500 length:153 start_codon:yes stop_codon:yes gene_type:complete
MNKKFIYKLIKTECGRAKYENLASNKTSFGVLRLYWFIIIAAIRDLRIKN